MLNNFEQPRGLTTHERISLFNEAPTRSQTVISELCAGTGSSKFLIYGINIEEPAAPAAISRWGQAPPLTAAPKPIVSAWNPDESWDNDPAVRKRLASCSRHFCNHNVMLMWWAAVTQDHAGPWVAKAASRWR